MNEKEIMPLHGAESFYGISIIIITIIAIILSKIEFLNLGKIHGTPMVITFVSLGIIFAIEGFIIWLKAAIGKDSVEKYLEANTLCTSGVYGIVRNPYYSGIMLICIGVLFIAHNFALLVLPILYWLVMTIMLVLSEEKWLTASFGDEYKKYRKKVNRCIPWFPKKTKKRIVFNIITFVIVVLGLIPFLISGYLYEEFFGVRSSTTEWQTYYTSDFNGLQRTEYDFVSNKGQKLVGYLYYVDDTDYRGVVVFGHGFGGGGHNSYMECANYFAHNGYYVYAFDATGNDESEGDAINGLSQQIIDMDYAISNVENLKETKNLPIMLFGHSWGGYTVTNEIKYHPEVKAVVSLAGFNESSDLIKAQGKELLGDGISLFMPCVSFYEKLKLGKYADCTSLDSFSKTDTAVLVYHCDEDQVVPREYGYDKWQQVFGASDRFQFNLITGMDKDYAHNFMYFSKDAIDWLIDFDKEIDFDNWCATLDYDYKDSTNKDRFTSDKNAYILSKFDRSKWCHCINEDMFADMVQFYDNHLND